jgi:hypothetical protein
MQAPTGPPPPQTAIDAASRDPEKPKKKKRKLNKPIAILGFLTALLGLTSAILGVVAHDTAQKNESLTINYNEANSAKVSAEASVSAAQSTISSLQSQLASSAPTPTTETTAPPDVTVRHAGEITMYSSSQGGLLADLDAPKTDPTWKGNGGSDLTYGGLSFGYGSYSRQIIFKAPSKPTYDGCKNSTEWSRAELDSRYLNPGDFFCFTTGEGRYAIVQLLSWQSNVAKIYATVYDPPDPALPQ